MSQDKADRETAGPCPRCGGRGRIGFEAVRRGLLRRVRVACPVCGPANRAAALAGTGRGPCPDEAALARLADDGCPWSGDDQA